MKNCLTIILTLLSIAAHAAWRPPVTNYSSANSLAVRQSWMICEHSNGWIYFANNRGLLEYNGYDWNLRTLNNYNVVRSVASADSGEIYVGGSGEIGRFEVDDFGRLSYSSLVDAMPQSMRSFGDVWDVHPVLGHVYFQLRRSIYILDNHGEFRAVTPSGIINASCVVNNSLYFATTTGLYVMGDNEPIAVGITTPIPFEEVVAMTPYGEGKILLATSFHGLYLYDGGFISKFSCSADDFLRRNQLFSIASNSSHIACGTVRGGVVTMDVNGEDAEQYDIKSGMGNNTILSVMFDKAGDLWCGLDNGVDFISLSSPLRHAEANREFRFSGYCSLQDDKYIYMGTNQGLLRINRPISRESLMQSEDQPNVIANSEGQVWNLQKIGGRIYCCHTRGLFYLQNFHGRAMLKAAFTTDGVWNVIPISDRLFLLSTYEGLYRVEFDGAHGYTSQHITGFNGSVRDMFYQAPMRSGYFVSEHGLERLQFDKDFSTLRTQRLLESTAFDIKLLRIDRQLIVYTPWEIYTVSDDGSLQPTSAYDKLLNKGDIYSTISVEEDKNIWFVSDNRLLRAPYEPDSATYSEHSEVIFADPNFFILGFTHVEPLNEQYYIVSGVDGFSVVDTERKRSDVVSIKPRIIGLYDTNNRDSLILSGAYGLDVDRVELPFSSNSLRISFGNNTVNDHGVEYSYMLEGSDEVWSEWISVNSGYGRSVYNQKEYTQLFEGNYNFLLRVRDSFGNIEQSSLQISISPPWHRTSQMYLLYAVIFVAAVLYSRKRINQYYADRRRLVELQSERQIEFHKRRFESHAIVQENNIIKLKNEKLEGEILAKSAELSNLLLNKLEKNDIISEVKVGLKQIKDDAMSHQHSSVVRRVMQLDRELDEMLVDNVDWSSFEDNFNITNNNFIHKIVEKYSWMNISERKLCVYIKMGLQNKEIAPLLNLSVRGVEMMRYRIRKKMELDRSESLYEFFQQFS